MHEECKIEEFDVEEEGEELSPYLKDEAYEEITSLEQELLRYLETKGLLLVEPEDKEKQYFQSNRMVRPFNNKRKTSSIWKKRKGNQTLNNLSLQINPISPIKLN